MKKLMAIPAIAVVATVSGCSSTSGLVVSSPPASSASSPSSSSSGLDEDEAAADTATEGSDYSDSDDYSDETADDTEDVAAFGTGFTWRNGLKAKVSKPVVFQPAQWAVPQPKPGDKFVRLKVTITNNTGEVYDPSMASVTASSGGMESEEVFDSEGGLNGSPDTKVLDGKSVTYSVGFRVENPKDVLVELSPGFEYDPGLFN